MNIGYLGKGNCSNKTAQSELVAQIKAGACGLKIHEDWGTTPAAIDAALTIADQYDVQVCIHTDTLNEAGCVEDTLKEINGRTIHTYHTEGAGGGHAPDILKVAGHKNVIPASTNPTMPFTVNTLDEHLDMLMVCHHFSCHLMKHFPGILRIFHRGEEGWIKHDFTMINMLNRKQKTSAVKHFFKIAEPGFDY